MDQTLLDSIRKKLELKSTADLRQACLGGDTVNRSPEEMEAIRQVLEERGKNSTRLCIALSAAAIMGTIGAAVAWWQRSDETIILLAGMGCAALGFASFYVPGLFGHGSPPPK